MPPRQKKINKQSAPAEIKTVVYKGHRFDVRQNMLGVGKELAAVLYRHQDNNLINALHIYRLPEYDRYLSIMNESGIILKDITAQKAKLKMASRSDAKKLNEIIAKGEADYAMTVNSLKTAAILKVSLAVNNIDTIDNFSFRNDIDNLRDVCNALLIGDLSVIDYDNPDNDLKQLADTVFNVFFSIRGRILSGQI